MTRSTWDIHDVFSDEHVHIYAGQVLLFLRNDKFERTRVYLATWKAHLQAVTQVSTTVSESAIQYMCRQKPI